MKGTRWMTAAAVGIIGSLTLAGCSSDDQASAKDDKITVVASTNVYGDIVKSIAGDHVKVESVIDSAAQDPHSYEATAQDRLKIDKADLLVENGGGYDSFMDDLSQGSSAQKIDAVSLSGLPGAEEASGHDHDSSEGEDEHHHDHGSFNEHVWYSPTVMKKVTESIAEKLGSIDAAHKDDYSAKAKELSGQLDGLQDRAAALNGKGKGFLATEPVPAYLLQASGLEDKTPTEFYEAIEGDSDVPASVLQSIRDELSSGSIALLGFNQQTESPQTEELRKYAEEQHVPTATFMETLPEGKHYVEWMNSNLDSVASALKDRA
ncbi:metal ABC transporter solute-binding protein, Zn/Mn family [Kocuria massiliensis]|uniref:metal ABC transporter solute-binding protein, Zn/Mn family n=1 Tax=Kocuria massiliensis TaxID=1926282 RepID=UPI0022B9B11C|nr:zinc ABC transporter substrate-binding protein [Kocuria massiliensis]